MRLRRLAYGFSTAILSVSSLFVLVSPAVHAAGLTCTWTGLAGDNLFSTTNNWSGCEGAGLDAPQTGDLLVFPGANVPTYTAPATASPEIVLDYDLSVAGLSFTGTVPSSSTYPSYKIGGTHVLTLTGDISNTSTGYVTLNTNVTLGANVVATETSGIDFGVSGSTGKTLALGSNNLTVANYTNVTSTVSGSGTLTLTNGGNIMGDNTGFTGTFKTTADMSYLSFSGPNSLKGSVDLAAKGSITVGAVYGATTTFANAFTFNGAGFTGQSQGGTSYAVPTISVSMSGSITAGASSVEFTNATFTADATFQAYARLKDTFKFSGSGLGTHAMTALDGSQGTLTFGGSNITAKPSIDSSASDSQPTWPVIVGDNNITVINGERSDVTVNAGGILKGSGKIGILTVDGGTVAPGNSPGVLSTGNVIYTSGTLDEEIGGTGAGEFDQLNVTGTVDLGSATTLNVSHWNNYRPKQNDSFMIIKNDAADAVTGTFSGLAEGAKLTVDGVEYTITYKGGDGNDVVLTATSVPTSAKAPNTGFAMLNNNPLLTLVLTLIAVAGISLAARKQLTSKTRE
jgi:hypothetical protein